MKLQVTKWMVFAGLLTVSMVLFLTAMIHAEEPPGKSAAPMTRSHSLGIGKPKPIAQASWPVNGFNRTLRFHQADTTDASLKNTFFVTPLLALRETDKPIPGYPAVVHDVLGQRGNCVALSFKAVLFDEKVKAVGEAAIATQFAEGLRLAGIRSDKVEVRPWPITRAVIDCKVGRKVLATGETESLVGVHDTIDFILEFTPESLKEFQTGAEAGRVSFAFSYTFENTQVGTLEATQAASQQVRREVADVLLHNVTPEQRDGSQLLTLKQVTDLKHLCQVESIRRVRANTKELLQFAAEASPLSRCFEFKGEVKWEELDKNDPLRAELSKSLAPLLKNWATSNGSKIDKSQEQEHKVEVTKKLNGGLSFKIPIIDVGITGGAKRNETDTRRTLLKEDYGITTKEDQSGQYLVPVSVAVYRFTGGELRIDVSDAQAFTVGLGVSESFYEDTPAPITFTQGKLQTLLASAQIQKPAAEPLPQERLRTAERASKRSQTTLGRSKQDVANAESAVRSAQAVWDAAAKELNAAATDMNAKGGEYREAQVMHQAALAKPVVAYHRCSQKDKDDWDEFTRKKASAALDAWNTAQSTYQAASAKHAIAQANLQEAKANLAAASRAATDAEREADKRNEELEDVRSSLKP